MATGQGSPAMRMAFKSARPARHHMAVPGVGESLNLRRGRRRKDRRPPPLALHPALPPLPDLRGGIPAGAGTRRQGLQSHRAAARQDPAVHGRTHRRDAAGARHPGGRRDSGSAARARVVAPAREHAGRLPGLDPGGDGVAAGHPRAASSRCVGLRRQLRRPAPRARRDPRAPAGVAGTLASGRRSDEEVRHALRRRRPTPHAAGHRDRPPRDAQPRAGGGTRAAAAGPGGVLAGGNARAA